MKRLWTTKKETTMPKKATTQATEVLDIEQPVSFVEEPITKPEPETLVEEATINEEQNTEEETHLDIETTEKELEVPEDPEDYAITYYKKGPKNWGNASLWFGSVYAFLISAIIGTIYLVTAVVLETFNIQLEAKLLSYTTLFLNSWLAAVSLTTGVLGLFAAKYNGFGIKQALSGVLITLFSTGTIIALLAIL